MTDAYCLLNGAPVVEALITLPRSGAWHALLAVDTATAPSGQVTLTANDGALQLSGTVASGGAFVDTGILRVVGGAGGLGRTLKPRSYRDVPLKLVLQDLLAAAGEHLSPVADGAVLGLHLDAWVSASAPAGTTLSDLVDVAAGALWRVADDGTVWVGKELWTPTVLDFEVISEEPQLQQRVLDVPGLGLRPGQIHDGRKVSIVEYRFGAEGLRTVAWYEHG